VPEVVFAVPANQALWLQVKICYLARLAQLGQGINQGIFHFFAF